MDIAKKIVISKWPEVYNMNQNEFDSWVLSLSQEDEDWLDRKVVNVLFKKNFKKIEDVDEFIKDLELQDKGRINKEKLYYNGVGENFFSFNEQDPKELVINNKTLFDYDKSEFLRKEDVLLEYSPERLKENYKGLELFHDWCRLYIDDNLVYGTLDSLTSFVTSTLESFLDDEIERIYPHEYVNGKDHGKSKNGGFVWNMVVDANGKEKHLDELRKRVMNDYFYKVLNLEILKYCEEINLDSVFVKREKDEDGVSDYFHFIFSDLNVAKRINLKSFYTDVIENESKDWDKVDKAIVKFKEKIINKINIELKDIEENFKGNVVDIESVKKKNIVVTKKFLDQLDD